MCVKSGNAVILRGGKEAAHSNRAIAEILAEAAAEAGLPADAVQLVDTTDREAVGHFLALARVHRPGDSPRRRGADPPRGGRGQDAGHQALHRQLPRLSSTARPIWTWPSGSRSMPSASGWASATRPSRWWSMPTWPPRFLPPRRPGAGRARRRDPRRRRARGSCVPAAKPATEEDFFSRISGADDLGQGGRFAGRGDRAHQPLRLAAHRRDRHPRPGRRPASSPPGSTARR